MNQRAKYEMTIADKLEQLSVPDMVDAIWSRIENQLDIDLPTDDGPPEPPSSPSAGGGAWTTPALVMAITAFIVTLFFITRKKADGDPAGSAPESVPTLEAPAGAAPGSPPAPSRTTAFPTGPAGDQVSPLPPADSNFPAQTDASLQAPVMDSASNAGTAGMQPDATPSPATGDSIPKKSRGVKGIKDDDYRVIPKRDSN